MGRWRLDPHIYRNLRYHVLVAVGSFIWEYRAVRTRAGRLTAIRAGIARALEPPPF